MKGLIAKIEALPPRPRVIHASPCVHCPSAAYARGEFEDPLMDEATQWPRAEQVESAFPCAWRPEKLCKGYCDVLKVTEDDLK
jgi:hypothetical protein